MINTFMSISDAITNVSTKDNIESFITDKKEYGGQNEVSFLYYSIPRDLYTLPNAGN